MQNADIAALWDSCNLNAGFLVIRPSLQSQQLYQSIRRLTARRGIDDQRALNRAVRMTKMQRNHDEILRVSVLDRNQFVNGRDYFERPDRKFPNLFDGCEPTNKSKCPLVLHNNWIVSKEAKIYRFREHLMWLYDGDDQYYSSEARNYLTYTNPTPRTSPRNATERELSALKTALVIGRLLNRVVILPRFHCGIARRLCPLNSIIHIKTFDSIFSGRYRESSFLRHPKVPDSVKQSVADRRLVLHAYQTSDALVSDSDVLRLFSELSDKVLNMGNLPRVKVGLGNRSVDSEFSSKLQTAIRRARYRQIH